MATSKYRKSKEVKKSQKELKKVKKAQPGAYQSAWQAQLDAAMDKILNREAFSYNMNEDMLYRQYKDQAIRSGRLAMMDTMGQAAAMTGGYGSSYGQSVGQQSYQQQLQSLNDRVPELYALALEQYDRQGKALRDEYDLLYGRETQDYDRYRDSVDDWQAAYDRSWDQYTANRDFDYNSYRDRVSDKQWKKELKEQKRQFNRSIALRVR